MAIDAELIEDAKTMLDNKTLNDNTLDALMNEYAFDGDPLELIGELV